MKRHMSTGHAARQSFGQRTGLNRQTVVRAFAAMGLALMLGGAQAQSAPAKEAAKEAAKVDPSKGQKIAAEVCAGCHGADGNSATPANPKLAGQHADYLYKQLVNFKPKAGAKEAERANAVMAGFAGTLSEADARNVAAYFGAQKLKPASAKNKDIIELGQKIYRGGIASKSVAACAGCHGPSGAGIPAQYPKLAGQFAEYSEAQLVAFRQGARKNSVQMTAIASRLSDVEIKAVSEYMAGLR